MRLDKTVAAGSSKRLERIRSGLEGTGRVAGEISLQSPSVDFDGALFDSLNGQGVGMHRLIKIALLVVALTPFAAQAVTMEGEAPDFTLEESRGQELAPGGIPRRGRADQLLGDLVRSLPARDADSRSAASALRGHRVYGARRVNVEGEAGPAQELVDKTKVTFPVLIDDGQRVSELYDLEAMPSTYVVDRDGKLRYVHRGYKPGDEAKYVEVVKALIKE